jgi:hypothetical protein
MASRHASGCFNNESSDAQSGIASRQPTDESHFLASVIAECMAMPEYARLATLDDFAEAFLTPPDSPNPPRVRISNANNTGTQRSATRLPTSPLASGPAQQNDRVLFSARIGKRPCSEESCTGEQPTASTAGKSTYSRCAQSHLQLLVCCRLQADYLGIHAKARNNSSSPRHGHAHSHCKAHHHKVSC